MNPYEALHVYYGDIHNHCGISYGHGTLEEALKNAREQLDFCSVTGHAAWSDLPIRTERSGHIIDFHLKGFNKLKSTWEQNESLFRRENSNGKFLTFLSYEIHSSSEGDHTILFKNLDEEIIYADTIDKLKKKLQKIKSNGHEVILFPHHIGYKRGYRGIDWDKFSPELSPFVEIISMHGCSEGSESPYPFLHSMGPIDWESCMQYGLGAEKVFGVIGSTDHHSAHPGSYGHGLCA